MRCTKRAFTLVEILVAIAIISVLLSILYVSFEDSRAATRDAERKTALTQLQLAVETYKAQNGRYPRQGCGEGLPGGAAWTGEAPFTQPYFSTCSEWIEGLVPEYIDELPVDPYFVGEDDRGYYYRTDAAGTIYKIMAHDTVEDRPISGFDDKFARCPNACIHPGTGTEPPWCDTATGPSPFIYAVYSPGAECL